jgi:hypothetical protein
MRDMTVSRHERWRGIETVVARLGEVSREEIERHLPPEMGLGGRALGKVVRRMVVGGRLQKVRHGVFRLHPNHKAHAHSVFEFTERRILEILRECGGIAKREEIDKGLGIERRGAQEYGYVLAGRVLRESPHFRQDFGHGYWNLDRNERDKLPLTGYWAVSDLGYACRLLGSHHSQQRFFEAVGGAFAEARDRSCLDIDVAACDPAIWEGLSKIVGAAKGLRAEVVNEVREMAQVEVRRKGITGGPEAFATLQAHKTALIPTCLAMFEAGREATHLSADAAFYRACAALYGVCPAKLSRGSVEAIDG